MIKRLGEALLLVALSACSPSVTGTYQISPTAPAPISSPTPVPPVSVTHTPTAMRIVATATSDPYISFAGRLDRGKFSLIFTDGVLKGKSINASLASPLTLGKFTSTSEVLKVGNNYILTRPEKSGIIVLNMHSGYWQSKPLEAEIFRYYLEHFGEKNEKYVLEKMNALIGAQGTISGVDFIVTSVIRSEHPEAEEIQANPENLLDIIRRKNGDSYLALGSEESFQALENPHSPILIVFCGWENKNPSYYRYVVTLEEANDEKRFYYAGDIPDP